MARGATAARLSEAAKHASSLRAELRRRKLAFAGVKDVIATQTESKEHKAMRLLWLEEEATRQRLLWEEARHPVCWRQGPGWLTWWLSTTEAGHAVCFCVLRLAAVGGHVAKLEHRSCWLRWTNVWCQIGHKSNPVKRRRDAGPPSGGLQHLIALSQEHLAGLHQEDVPRSRTDTQNVLLCREELTRVTGPLRHPDPREARLPK